MNYDPMSFLLIEFEDRIPNEYTGIVGKLLPISDLRQRTAYYWSTKGTISFILGVSTSSLLETFMVSKEPLIVGKSYSLNKSKLKWKEVYKTVAGFSNELDDIILSQMLGQP